MTKPTKLSLCPLAPIDGDFSETRPLEIDGFPGSNHTRRATRHPHACHGRMHAQVFLSLSPNILEGRRKATETHAPTSCPTYIACPQGEKKSCFRACSYVLHKLPSPVDNLTGTAALQTVV